MCPHMLNNPLTSFVPSLQSLIANVPILFKYFSSVAQSCPTLCNPMDCSTPGVPVHHQLLELAQIPVHGVTLYFQ